MKPDVRQWMLSAPTCTAKHDPGCRANEGWPHLPAENRAVLSLLHGLPARCVPLFWYAKGWHK